MAAYLPILILIALSSGLANCEEASVANAPVQESSTSSSSSSSPSPTPPERDADAPVSNGEAAPVEILQKGESLKPVKKPKSVPKHKDQNKNRHRHLKKELCKSIRDVCLETQIPVRPDLPKKNPDLRADSNKPASDGLEDRCNKVYTYCLDCLEKHRSDISDIELKTKELKERKEKSEKHQKEEKEKNKKHRKGKYFKL